MSSDGSEVAVEQRLRGRRAAFAITWLAYASYYLGRKGFSVAKAIGVGLAAGVGQPHPTRQNPLDLYFHSSNTDNTDLSKRKTG